jgi:hypothetical protein
MDGTSLEDSILVALLLAMIVLAVTQIALRNGFDTGITWADALLSGDGVMDCATWCNGCKSRTTTY